MSVTFDFGCVDCQLKMWVGQRDYLYSSKAHIDGLAAFMLKHKGHHLTVADDNMSILEDCATAPEDPDP